MSTRRWAAAAIALVTPLGIAVAARADVGTPSGGAPDRVAAAAPASRAAAPAKQVLAMSVDGLNVNAITRLGRAGAPSFHRLIDQGATTLNARTEAEQTITLPNHAGMMTGRRIDRRKGGHGVTWDLERPGSTVQKAAGHRVGSVFSVVHAAGGSTALFTTKSKFALYHRSWPRAISRYAADGNQARLVRTAIADLAQAGRAFTFLHTSLPDRAGHAHGGMSAQYLAAVRRTDRLLGQVLAAVDADPALRDRVVVMLTADHGFRPGSTSHSQVRRPANYRVPFLVWGAGVAHGDLYALNPDYRDPGSRRPSYAGRQPVRNGDVANLALDLLGLRAIRGSLLDARQDLDVR